MNVWWKMEDLWWKMDVWWEIDVWFEIMRWLAAVDEVIGSGGWGDWQWWMRWLAVVDKVIGSGRWGDWRWWMRWLVVVDEVIGSGGWGDGQWWMRWLAVVDEVLMMDEMWCEVVGDGEWSVVQGGRWCMWWLNQYTPLPGYMVLYNNIFILLYNTIITPPGSRCLMGSKQRSLWICTGLFGIDLKW